MLDFLEKCLDRKTNWLNQKDLSFVMMVFVSFKHSSLCCAESNGAKDTCKFSLSYNLQMSVALKKIKFIMCSQLSDSYFTVIVITKNWILFIRMNSGILHLRKWCFYNVFYRMAFHETLISITIISFKSVMCSNKY